MKTRRILAVLAIVAALGMLASGCGQSNEQVETSSCPGSDADKACDMECAVTCSGAEGTSEYVVTCEGHDTDGKCEMMCEGPDGEMECTITCDGVEGEKTCTVTCTGDEGEKTFTVTCDGKTVTCEHADGEECTCAPISVSGCPGAKVADFTCASKASGTCPMSAAAKTEEATK